MNSEDRTRVESPQPVAREWAQAIAARTQLEAASPGAHATAAVSAEQNPGSRRSWWRTGLRLARDASIGLLLIAAIPLAYVAAYGDRIWFHPDGFRERIAQVEQLRPLVLPKDGRLSPADAGYAFHALQPAQENADFPLRAVSAAAGFGWEKLEPTSHLFAAYRTPKSGGLPSSTQIVSAAALGFSTEEMEFLRVIAEAPVWPEVDRIVGAREVDLIGGRFVLPFRPDARALMMPVHKFDGTKAIANAGVSRAAYYVALGDTKRAEAALKSIVSFGFVLIDNGTSAIDGLIGQVVANIGRDGLHQLYTLTGNEEGLLLTIAPPTVRASAPGPMPMRLSVGAARDRMINEVTDPGAPRTLRYEALRSLSFGTCGSVQGVLFGHPDDTEASFDEARGSLARFPSEDALLDLYYNSPRHTLTGDLPSLSRVFVLGAAAVTATLTNNPRVMTCTRLISTTR